MLRASYVCVIVSVHRCVSVRQHKCILPNSKNKNWIIHKKAISKETTAHREQAKRAKKQRRNRHHTRPNNIQPSSRRQEKQYTHA